MMRNIASVASDIDQMPDEQLIAGIQKGALQGAEAYALAVLKDRRQQRAMAGGNQGTGTLKDKYTSPQRAMPAGGISQLAAMKAGQMAPDMQAMNTQNGSMEPFSPKSITSRETPIDQQGYAKGGIVGYAEGGIGQTALGQNRFTIAEKARYDYDRLMKYLRSIGQAPEVGPNVPAYEPAASPYALMAGSDQRGAISFPVQDDPSVFDADRRASQGRVVPAAAASSSVDPLQYIRSISENIDPTGSSAGSLTWGDVGGAPLRSPYPGDLAVPEYRSPALRRSPPAISEYGSDLAAPEYGVGAAGIALPQTGMDEGLVLDLSDDAAAQGWGGVLANMEDRGLLGSQMLDDENDVMGLPVMPSEPGLAGTKVGEFYNPQTGEFEKVTPERIAAGRERLEGAAAQAGQDRQDFVEGISGAVEGFGRALHGEPYPFDIGPGVRRGHREGRQFSQNPFGEAPAETGVLPGMPSDPTLSFGTIVEGEDGSATPEQRTASTTPPGAGGGSGRGGGGASPYGGIVGEYEQMIQDRMSQLQSDTEQNKWLMVAKFGASLIGETTPAKALDAAAEGFLALRQQNSEEMWRLQEALMGLKLKAADAAARARAAGAKAGAAASIDPGLSTDAARELSSVKDEIGMVRDNMELLKVPDGLGGFAVPEEGTPERAEYDRLDNAAAALLREYQTLRVMNSGSRPASIIEVPQGGGGVGQTAIGSTFPIGVPVKG